jgi:hypothetical protein
VIGGDGPPKPAILVFKLVGESPSLPALSSYQQLLLLAYGADHLTQTIQEDPGAPTYPRDDCHQFGGVWYYRLKLLVDLLDYWFAERLPFRWLLTAAKRRKDKRRGVLLSCPRIRPGLRHSQ